MNTVVDADKALCQRLSVLMLTALGVVYGDIGTSPLYAMKEVFAGNHPIPVTELNVFGSLSLFFWALIMVVSIKYVIVIMRANNRGEGGIMALIALALQSAQQKPRLSGFIVFMGVLGAAMFYGDGIVTPAISVLSAVEGLEVAAPGLKPYVIPITLVVLLLLFSVQKHGTAIIGGAFGPIMLVWFSVLAWLGMSHILDNPRILYAINPAYAFEFLLANKALSLMAMGNVVLAVTGAEALYADMGHFGLKPIRRAWFALVLPALLLNYFGQGALILSAPDAAANPFFKSAPIWALYPLIALATLSTVIASQAVISGAFSVTRQAVQLGFLPRMSVLQTSEKEIGQIYLPGINWALCVAVMILVIGFKSSNNLAAAYGIAVTGDMVITSILACIVVAKTWRWGWVKALSLFAVFLSIELLFLAANILKIPDGGWFPLVTGFCTFLVMTTWKHGSELLRSRLQSDNVFSLKEFSKMLQSDSPDAPARVQGTAVFLSSDPDAVPHALLHNLMHNHVLHHRVVVVAVDFCEIPYVPQIDRKEVRQIDETFWRILIRYGFKDEPNLPLVLEQSRNAALDFDPMTTSYFIGRAKLLPPLQSKMTAWREKLFALMYRNAGSATDFFAIPSNRVVELGTQIRL